MAMSQTRRLFLRTGVSGLGLGAWRARGQDGTKASFPPTRVITRGPGFHWFGYYDKLQFDASNRYVLGMEVRFEHRSPTPADTIRIGMVDLNDGDRWIDGSVVAEDILQQGGVLLGKLLARADSELKGTSPTRGGGNEADRIVAPVEFPPASDFNFANYIEPANRDRFWEDNWDR